MTDHLIIFDTTLRDGEQSPGASMTKDEKIRIAKALERMRVDAAQVARSHGLVTGLLAHLESRHGLPCERIAPLGFSQG